jgi:hypothetical protein
MVFNVATFTAQASQSGAPSSYVADNLVSEWYVVSLKQGWTTPSAPTSGTLYIWQKKGVSGNAAGTGPDTDVIVGSIALPTVTGQSASVVVHGNSGNLAVTVSMSGGSSPTFTGSIIADGQMNDSNPGV